MARNNKLNQEIADEIRILYKKDGLTQKNIKDYLKETYDIEISLMGISDVINNVTYVKRPNIAQRADGYRNLHAAKIAQLEDDKFDPVNHEHKQLREDDDKLDVNDIGYGLEF